MFILYGVVGSFKVLDLSIDEKDIVDTIVQHHNARCECNYLIHSTDGTTDIRITNEEELRDYLSDYKERHMIKPLNDMSCVELKRQILNGYRR